MKLIWASLFLIAASLATVVKVPILMDTYLDSSNPNSNYGSVQDGLVFESPYTGAFFELCFTVNISNLAPSAVNVSALYLQPYISSYEVVGGQYMSLLTFDVYELNATSWSEYTATYANPPSTLRKTASNWNDNNVNYVTVPITTIFNDAATAGRQLISVRVHSSQPNDDVWMKEASTQNAPYILVYY